MRRLLIVVFILVLAVHVQSGHAELYTYMIGDNDGFGSGVPVVPGDTITDFGTMDPDGTDGLVVPAWESWDYTFTFPIFSSIVGSSLFVQYADWPETASGLLRIDGHNTAHTFSPLSPWQQDPPWTVFGATIDLMPYVDYLYDGTAVFELVNGTDAYSIDYLRLSVDGVVVPAPGAALLGTIGLLYSGWRLKRRQM